jgi:hypothetical protein
MSRPSPANPAPDRHGSLRLRIRTGRLPRLDRAESDDQFTAREPDELNLNLDEEPPTPEHSMPPA